MPCGKLPCAPAGATVARRLQGACWFRYKRQRDDPTRFILIEAYRTPEDPARHKETAHYLRWRETVAGMMAEDRRGVVCDCVFFDGQG